MRRVRGRVLCIAILAITLTLLVGCNTSISTEPKPRVTYVSFPSTVVADGGKNPGTIGFSDTHGDIVLVQTSEGGQVTGSWDPEVQGQTTGSFPFWYQVRKAGSYTVSVRLTDAGGRTSNPYSFSYQADPIPPGPAYHVTVGQIIDEFDANEVAAELKYEDKMVAVTGYIEDFDTYWGHEPIVILGSQPGEDVFDPQVLCYFPEEGASSVAQLSKGDFVTIVGEYWMYGLGNVYIHYCYLE